MKSPKILKYSEKYIGGGLAEIKTEIYKYYEETDFRLGKWAYS